MRAILSCTYDDLYLFNLPFAVHSWAKLGVPCSIFMPVSRDLIELNKFSIVYQQLPKYTSIYYFTATKEKEATYAQCSRLYGAAIPGWEHNPTETLITSDADMCVFNKHYWDFVDLSNQIWVIGVDLVPAGQYPMCYISMHSMQWRKIMKIGDRSYQQCLDDLLGTIEAEHFRGNYWAKDQETAYNMIEGEDPVDENYNIECLHCRAMGGNQFAVRRADRDGWQVTPDIIDAHLPRPGFTDENFAKIFHLFEDMYPEDDHIWMERYRDEYLKLLHRG